MDPTFALPEQSGLGQPGFGGLAGKPGEAPKVNTIANNSGGGIPGQGGGGQASLGGAPGKLGAGAAGGAGYTTDIDQGFRSGGYAAGGDGGSNDNGGGSGFGGGRGLASVGGRMPASQGLDLKKYLPGGALAGARAGGMRAQSSEIHGRFVDIWSRISERFLEKCKLGELTGCS